MPSKTKKQTRKLEDYSKEELIETIKSLQTKKYGLVWKDKPEHVAEMCETELPVLEEIGKRTIEKADDKPTNLIVEGDNYHALSVLNYTHAGKIDVIYIDPPYNTGNKSWRYNNDYVDTDDEWKHSKWLSFMSKRLKLAKNLLSERGSLICAIDHNEQEALGLLLKEIFPNKEITCVTIVHNPRGIQGENFSYTHEYAYFVYPHGKYINRKKRKDEDQEWSNLRNWGGESTREFGKSLFYPIYFKNNKVYKIGDVPRESFHPKTAYRKLKDGIVEVWPIDNNGIERKWRYSRDTLFGIKRLIRLTEIRSVPQVQIKKLEDRYKTVWIDSKYDASVYGTQLINEMIGRNFPFPKSLYTVKECIEAVAADKPNAIVLDYFAGSGTTGHAVLKLNQEDGGNRQFILCTNNENGIAEKVTYPRIKKVITGYADEEGIPANIRYFKTNFVIRSDVSDNTRRELVQKSTEMICVKENTFLKKHDNKSFKIYTNGKTVTGILFDLDKISDFKRRIEKTGLSSNLYVFSLSNDTYDEDFADLSVSYSLCPIPESILEVYRKLFQ